MRRLVALRSASSSVWRISARLGRPVSEIEPRKPRDLLLGPALLGEVGADAAEPQKAPAFVKHRISRQRPMDILIAGGADDHVTEREARGQMEAERALLAQAVGRAGSTDKQVGELAAEQILGVAFEIVGKLLRDIGQGAEIVGFPEPAAAAVLELVDELQRLARLASRRRRARALVRTVRALATL